MTENNKINAIGIAREINKRPEGERLEKLDEVLNSGLLSEEYEISLCTNIVITTFPEDSQVKLIVEYIDNMTDEDINSIVLLLSDENILSAYREPKILDRLDEEDIIATLLNQGTDQEISIEMADISIRAGKIREDQLLSIICWELSIESEKVLEIMENYAREGIVSQYMLAKTVKDIDTLEGMDTESALDRYRQEGLINYQEVTPEIIEEIADTPQEQRINKIRELFPGVTKNIDESEYADCNLLGLPEWMTIGLELEVEFNGIIASEFFEIAKLLNKGWETEEDLSLINGVEMASPVLHDNEESWESLNEMCKALNTMNATNGPKTRGTYTYWSKCIWN